MRGQKQHGTNGNIEFALAELYGGIRQNIINFSAEIGISASWVAERVSTLLSPQRAGVLDHMPTMLTETTGARGAMESLEVVVNAHSSQAQPAIAAKQTHSQVPVNNHKVVKKQLNSFWKNMTPEQRSKEMYRRQMVAQGKLKPKQNRDSNAARKRKRAEEKAQLLAQHPQRLLGRNGKPKLTSEEKRQKQNLYVQRSVLKKQGVPEDQLPPLPSRIAADQTV